MTDDQVADLRAELDSCKREIGRLNDEVASAYEKLHAALSGSYERAVRLRTAWRSARIGRAKARQEAADLRTTLSLVGGGLNFVGDHAERVTAQRDQLMTLVCALIDPDDCWFDHNPSCQAHDYLNVKAGEKCPQARAKELLAAIDKTKAPGT